MNKVNEIEILGGTLTGFTGNGVEVTNCNAIVLTNVTSSKHVQPLGNGFYFNNTSAIFILQCTGQHNGTGLQATGCDDIIMTNSTFNQNYLDQDIEIGVVSS